MRPPQPSRAAAVWGALYTRIEDAMAQLPLAAGEQSVQVFKGPALDVNLLEPDVVAVGPGGEGQPGVFVSTAPARGLANAYVESVTVAVAVSSQRGNGDIDAAIDKCQQMLAAVHRVVSETPTLEGVWESLRMGEGADWFPVQNDQGAACDVAFTVEARSAV